MVYLDLCSNSIFLDKHDRTQINSKVHAFFKIIKSEFEERHIDANIYYTGSLARQEPAVVKINGECYLSSDIDFVIVTKNDFKNNDWLMNITDWLNFKYPEFKSSVVLTTLEKLSQLKSFLGRDLAFTIDFPIYQTISHDEILYYNNEICKKNYIENFINVASCYFLHPIQTGEESDSILYKDINHFYIKIVLEGLRLQFKSSTEVVGFSDIYTHRFSKEVSSLLDPQNIELFIHTREMFENENIPSIDVEMYSYNAIRGYFDIENEKQSLFDSIEGFITYDFISSFQSIMLIYMILMICNRNSVEETFTNKYVYLFVKTIKHILTLEQCENIKMKYKNFNLLAYTKKELIGLLRDIRLEYTKELYYYNTGIREIPDLKQKYRKK